MNPNKITYFAQTDARNQRVRFGIKAKDRTKHVYVIGKTGMGKSTLLENMAIQDIQNGEGLAFVDPHGKTAELLLEYVPEERIKDVVYFAPFDMDYPISFNVMEDVGMDKRHLVANGLMSAFKKIWVDAWSARMEYILNNILLALLEYPDSTILGVNRMLADKEYRKKVVDNISDVSVKSFWVDEFAKYGDRYMQEAGAAIQNKIGQFISNPLVRNIVGQPKSAFDLRDLMDKQKILIINLSKGRVGEANANLLGSMLVTKIYLGAMSRADVSESTLNRLPNFYLYVDEFQSFANESFVDILSEARKYKLNLTIAHQYIEQMSEEVRAAVFGNVGTMITFRVGAFDAEVLEKEFAPEFTAEDMVNLGFTQVYLKLMIDGVTSPPFSGTTLAPIERQPITYKNDCIEYTRKTFAKSRTVIESNIRDWSQTIKPEPKILPKKDFKDGKILRDTTVIAESVASAGVIGRTIFSKPEVKIPDTPLRNEPKIKGAPDANANTFNNKFQNTSTFAEKRFSETDKNNNENFQIKKETGSNSDLSSNKTVSLESLKDRRFSEPRSAQGNKEDLRQALASMLQNKEMHKDGDLSQVKDKNLIQGHNFHENISNLKQNTPPASRDLNSSKNFTRREDDKWLSLAKIKDYNSTQISEDVDNFSKQNQNKVDYYREDLKTADLNPSDSNSVGDQNHNRQIENRASDNSFAQNRKKNEQENNQYIVSGGVNSSGKNQHQNKNRNFNNNQSNTVSRYGRNSEHSKDRNLNSYPHHTDSLINVSVPSTAIAEKRHGTSREIPEKTLRKMLYVKRPSSI